MSLKLIVALVATFCVFAHGDEGDDLIVETNKGKVQGVARTTGVSGTKFFAFQGIPFAKPPVDDLRFEPPQDVDSWTGVLDATSMKNLCVQSIVVIFGDEDCLYLNVYTPTLEKDAKKPVMVYLFGGAFIMGTSSRSPDYFIEEDVVIVTINYRLGIYGFLSTGDEVISGNGGLKDQIAALKWVQANIENFGGDPGNVLLFGQSAGSVSASYLLQAPKLTEGLFHKAILQSGTGLNIWALARKKKESILSVAAKLRIDTTNSTVVVEELKKVEAKKLASVSFTTDVMGIIKDGPLSGLYFGPSTEPDIEGAVVTGNYHENLKEGNFLQIPLMVGVNSHEGLLFYIVKDILEYYLTLVDLKILVPLDMNLERDFTRKLISYLIEDYYFENGQTHEAVLNFISEDQFVRPIREFVRLTSKFTSVYHYVFSFAEFHPSDGIQGVPHSAELPYLWGSQPKQDAQQDLMRRTLVRLWSNFAKHGNPTPTPTEGDISILENVTWEKATDTESKYLNINQTLSMEVDFREKAMAFWKMMYDRYGTEPYDTY